MIQPWNEIIEYPIMPALANPAKVRLQYNEGPDTRTNASDPDFTLMMIITDGEIVNE